MARPSLLPCVTLLLLAAVLLDLPHVARGYPDGPPAKDYFDEVCNHMMPKHDDHSPENGTGGYSIETDIPRVGNVGFNYTAGKEYTVIIKGSNSTFRGFLVIAHVPGEDSMLLGTFSPQNESQQTVDCSSTGASNEKESSIGHKNSQRIDFQSITTKWTAPSDADGMVDFRFTIVHTFSVFYVYLRASLINGSTSPHPCPSRRLPEEYRLRFRDPPNCISSECDVFVGIDTNSGDPGFLDIYLEGTADGWVAVGFTETPDMFSADVVACNRNPNTGVVQGLDTYNEADLATNDVDLHQNNIVQFSSNYTGGRIICSVAKKIVATDPPPVNVNLDSKLYVLYGRRRAPSLPDSLLTHEVHPKISTKQYNPVKDKGDGREDTFPKQQLVRTHGALMLIAWPLLGISGIFFASWMRPALPKGQWFQVHRVFMLASLLIGVIGVAMAFVANAQESNPRGLIPLGSDNPVATAHFAIGLFIVLLQIINPILAAVRCHPDGKWRWVFNLVHGLSIGLGAGTLAMVNVGLGVYIFNDGISDLFLVYVGYASFTVILFGVMYFIFSMISTYVRDPDMAPFFLRSLIKYVTSSSYTPIDAGETVKVGYGSTNGEGQSSTDRQEKVVPPQGQPQPSRDSHVRYASLLVYLVVTIPLILAMIILAIVGSIDTL